MARAHSAGVVAGGDRGRGGPRDARRNAPIESFKQWVTGAALVATGVLAALMAGCLAAGATTRVAVVAGYATLIPVSLALSWGARDRGPGVARFIRAFAPVIVYPIAYGAIHAMLAAAYPGIVDAELAALDRAIFGVDPVAWLSAFGAHPGYGSALVDLFSLTYFSYYLGMPVLLLLMYFRNGERDFQRVLRVMMLGWYGALVTYALFPALGPQRFHPDELPVLAGALPTTAWIRAFLTANLTPAVRDCVPSMHTAITVLTLYFARRYQRGFFRIYLAPGIGVIIATVFLQQHYAVDVLFGLAAAVALIAVDKRRT